MQSEEVLALVCTRDQPTVLWSTLTAAELQNMKFSPCSQILASDDIIAAPLLLFQALVEVTHDRARMNQSRLLMCFVMLFM